MFRPFSDIRPLGPFAKTIRDRDSDDRLWVMHRIEVQKPNANIEDVKEGRVIREFGDMEKISESADELMAEDMDLGGNMLLELNTQGIVEYDIMPSTRNVAPDSPTEGVGVRLIYHVFEEHDTSEDTIETTNDAPIDKQYLHEQGEFYSDELEQFYPDADVMHAGSGVSASRPAPEDSGTVIYFTG